MYLIDAHIHFAFDASPLRWLSGRLALGYFFDRRHPPVGLNAGRFTLHSEHGRLLPHWVLYSSDSDRTLLFGTAASLPAISGLPIKPIRTLLMLTG
jgi:hypothetical protein